MIRSLHSFHGSDGDSRFSCGLDRQDSSEVWMGDHARDKKKTPTRERLTSLDRLSAPRNPSRAFPRGYRDPQGFPPLSQPRQTLDPAEYFRNILKLNPPSLELPAPVQSSGSQHKLVSQCMGKWENTDSGIKQPPPALFPDIIPGDEELSCFSCHS